jgi:hypothetical protein
MINNKKNNGAVNSHSQTPTLQNMQLQDSNSFIHYKTFIYNELSQYDLCEFYLSDYSRDQFNAGSILEVDGLGLFTFVRDKNIDSYIIINNETDEKYEPIAFLSSLWDCPEYQAVERISKDFGIDLLSVPFIPDDFASSSDVSDNYLEQPFFSFYNAPISNTSPFRDVSLPEIAEIIRSDMYKSLINRCRSEVKAVSDMIKKTILDYVTLSGSFEKRSTDGLSKYSGLICIDLDDLDDPENTKNKLAEDVSVPPLLIFTSPSGKGLKVVYKVAGDQSQHQQYFKALSSYLNIHHNIPADPSGKDVSRACFLSHDPDIYFRDDYLNVVPLGKDFISSYTSLVTRIDQSDFTQVLRNDVSEEDKDQILSIAANIVERSRDGEKHHELCKASYLLGGYVGGGVISADDARNALCEAIDRKPTVNSISAAHRAIDKCIEAGKQKPIYTYSKWENHYNEMDNSFFDDLLNIRFPLEVFPSPIVDIVRDFNNNLYFPVDYIAPSILFTASVALGKSAKINLKDGWSEFGNLFIALVGGPGRTKSHPLVNAIRPLTEIDSLNNNLYIEQKKVYMNKGPAENISDPPILKQFLVNDITLESLYKVHSQNPNGIGVHKDELLSWIREMDRYRRGADEQAWNSIFSNVSVRINRATDDPLFINDPMVSLIGTIQPGILSQFISESRQSSGFIDRVLFCYPDSFKTNKWNKDGISDITESTYRSIIDKLLSLSGNAPVILHLSAGASLLWEEFYNNNQLNKNDPNIPDSIKGIYAKMDSYVPRLALILQALYWASDSGSLSEIEEKAMQGAIDLSKYFIHCAIKARSKVNNNSQNLYSKKEVAIILKKLNISVRKIAKAIDVSATSVQNWVGDIKE